MEIAHQCREMKTLKTMQWIVTRNVEPKAMETLRDQTEAATRFARQLSVGAEVQSGGGVHFRIWAPRCQQVRVQILSRAKDVMRPARLEPENGGYFSLFVESA